MIDFRTRRRPRLYGEMRKRGLEALSQVKWAVLESAGTITFVAKDRTPTNGKYELGEHPLR